MSDLNNTLRIYSENPKDRDMGRVVEGLATKGNLLELFNQLKAKEEECEKLREFMNWAIEDVRYFTTKERWMTSDMRMKLDELGLAK